MMANKRPNSELPDGPPEKMPYQTQSNIEFTMLSHKYKALEGEFKERGTKLATKQQELILTKKSMDEMRADYDEQIKKLNNLLSFQNEEVNAHHFKESMIASSRTDLNSVRTTRPRQQSAKVLQSFTNIQKDPKVKEEEEREFKSKALVSNLLIRRLSANSKRKDEQDPFAMYKIENDTLPCEMNREGMWERFETVRDFLKKHPTHNVAFNEFRIPSRQEVLSSNIFESSDRSHRTSIWTAMHANRERFLYKDPQRPSLQRMHLIEKNMEYTSSYAENKNNFEKMAASDYQVPQWFSKFYV